MKINQKQVSRRLFKKMSALRATLSNDERALLDRIVVDEVVAHKSFGKSLAKSRKSLGKSREVAAHKMTAKSLGKSLGKAAKASRKASEVAAHKMTAKSLGKAARAAGRIVFDPITEEYQIRD